MYVCRINIDGKWYNGIGNVGVKPTVTEEHKRLVEVFVYDYEGDAYGKEITVEFCDFERPEIRFSSVNELKNKWRKISVMEKTTLRLQKKSKINSLHCKWHMIYYLRLENQPMFGNRITPTVT